MTRLKQLFSIAGLCMALPLAAHAAAPTVTYIYTDPQGTPLAETDAQGNVTATFDYRPYGTQALGTPPQGPGYTGHVNDADTGFVYMQARYYDPLVGRFLSRDPAGSKGGDIFGINGYAYANDNPYAYVDPDGRAVQALWGAPVGAIVEIAAQKMMNPRAPINWKSVGVSTVLGAATGGIASIARAAAVNGTITVSQAVGRTALANAALSGAGSAADSSVNGETPNLLKMGAAAGLGGLSSGVTGRLMSSKEISLNKMESSSVLSPEGIWGGHRFDDGIGGPNLDCAIRCFRHSRKFCKRSCGDGAKSH